MRQPGYQAEAETGSPPPACGARMHRGRDDTTCGAKRQFEYVQYGVRDRAVRTTLPWRALQGGLDEQVNFVGGAF